MKKLFTLIFCFVSACVNGQVGWINFDPGFSDYHTFISIDTNFHNNIWQVGKPNKTVFTSAFSAPYAIVTDTLNPYPVNDTSVFILKIPGVLAGYVPAPFSVNDISFKYQLDIDSGTTVTLEISEDSGAHWTNIIDSLPEYYSWTEFGVPIDTPNLKVSTAGWTSFYVSREPFSAVPDSILFRFTFISDSNHVSRDGWIIDDIIYHYYYESVLQTQNDNLITLYPNPSKGNIFIHSEKQYQEEPTVIVYNTKGQEVYKTNNLASTGYLNLPLPDGTYTLKYVTKDEYCVKRIIIAK